MKDEDVLHPRSLDIDIAGDSLHDFTDQVESFKKERGIHFVLAFSGGADDHNPLLEYLAGTEEAQSNSSVKRLLGGANEGYVASIIRDVLLPLRGYRLAVLMGGTSWGVPHSAAQIAKEFGFPTIGVFPLTAREKDIVLKDNLLDLRICVHPFIGASRWGDESFIFTKLLDAVIVIGGGAGTFVEVAHLLKCNEKSNAVIKYIVPIAGTGGTAEKIPYFPGKPAVMARCIPSTLPTNGAQACRCLQDHTSIEDAFDL